jgi:hypothetical protein
VLWRGDGSTFATSRATYLDVPPGLARRDAKIYVRVAVGAPDFVTTAMLDTGSTYSVLDADVADQLGAFEEADAPTVEMGTRRGILRGRLVRRQMWLLADEGDSLEVDGTFWVSPEWRHGHFLGYAGLLQRIRFALDPKSNQLYFGLIEV